MAGEKITLEDVEIEIVKEHHLLSDFISSEQELVDFLKEDALINQQQRLSVTFLWFYRGKMVSYITLLADRITLEGDLRSYFQEKGVHYRTLPALKIGRMCVDDHFQQRGLGRLMVSFAAEIAKEVSQQKMGCRFLTVDAKQNSVGFYLRMGFKPLEGRKITVPFYLDLSTSLL